MCSSMKFLSIHQTDSGSYMSKEFFFLRVLDSERLHTDVLDDNLQRIIAKSSLFVYCYTISFCSADITERHWNSLEYEAFHNLTLPSSPELLSMVPVKFHETDHTSPL